MKKIALALAGFGLASVASAQLINPGLNMTAGHTSTQTVGAGATYNGWTVGSGPAIEFVPSTVWQTHEGDGAIDLNGTQGPGTIFQQFATTPGQSYRVDFWYSGNPGPNGSTMGTKSFDVLWDGNQAGIFTFVHQATDRWNNMRWLSGSVTVLATGTSSILSFRGRNFNHPDAGAAIDDISVTPVPEPATIAMLGMGAAALFRRRKR
ncbi:MAG TPA: DUF642 domain-containing protein [Fimbriimonadaceae bacterium]|nr:DUF642 domain-containing protein [Fimbriimonadaceae bacterium]